MINMLALHAYVNEKLDVIVNADNINTITPHGRGSCIHTNNDTVYVAESPSFVIAMMKIGATACASETTIETEE